MKLVITPHRPVRKALITLALVVSVILALGVALDYGHWKSILAGMVSTGEKRTLLQEVVSLRRDNERLRDELARLRREQEINQYARKDNHEQMVRLQAEIADSRKEVEFYRDVVGATGVDPGPRVKGLQVRSLEGPGRYSYKLVMTHVNKDDRMAEGRLQFNVRGEQDGKRKNLSFKELFESGPNSLEFNFKHFYLFEGTLKIPGGFVPRQVQVGVVEKARRNSVHEQTYDWASVLN